MLCVSDLFMATIGTRSWLKLDDVLWTNFLLVFLEQTKLLLPAFPVGSQENRELYILLLFSNMQWKYGTKPSQSSSANLAQGTGSPVLLRRNFNQSNVAENECFCYKAFRLRFALWDAVFFLPLLCRLPTFREMRAGMNSCMEFFREKGGGWVTPPQGSKQVRWTAHLVMRCLRFMLLLRSTTSTSAGQPLCSYLLCIHSVENDFKKEQDVSKMLG